MRIIVGSLLIFFGTMLAAGLVELGRPGESVTLLPDRSAIGASQTHEAHGGWALVAAALGLR